MSKAPIYMNTNRKTTKRNMKNFSSVRLLQSIEDGIIRLPAFTFGHVTWTNHNEVDAFFFIKHDENVLNALGVDKKSRFRSVLFRLPYDYLAVTYDEKENGNLLIAQELAITIPFVNIEMLDSFDEHGELSASGPYYALSHLHRQAKDGYKAWVKRNITFTSLPAEKAPSESYPGKKYEECVVEKDVKSLFDKKFELEEAFAIATKTYADFESDLHLYRGLVVKDVDKWNPTQKVDDLQERKAIHAAAGINLVKEWLESRIREDEIRIRLREISAGDWRIVPYKSAFCIKANDVTILTAFKEGDPDIQFIANAPDDVRYLLKKLEITERERDEAAETIRELKQQLVEARGSSKEF